MPVIGELEITDEQEKVPWGAGYPDLTKEVDLGGWEKGCKEKRGRVYGQPPFSPFREKARPLPTREGVWGPRGERTNICGVGDKRR